MVKEAHRISFAIGSTGRDWFRLMGIQHVFAAGGLATLTIGDDVRR
jgi:hypothetical protein